MDYIIFLCLVFANFATLVRCATIQNSNYTQDVPVPVPQSQSRSIITYSNFIPCGLTMDISCFVDTADAYVAQKRSELLAEADGEALVSGRASEEGTTPSALVSTISKIISELTDLFKDGFSGFFKNARESEDDDEDESEEKDEGDKGDSVGVARKKKKGKIKGLIKLIIIGVVLKAVLTLLLKFLSAALQVKFFLVALAGLILNAARFYLDLKKGHQPQKVIYYEHAQHQHHYDGGDEDWSSPGGDHWGRSYDEKDSSNAQDLAYSKQKPSGSAYSRVDSKPSYSWFD